MPSVGAGVTLPTPTAHINVTQLRSELLTADPLVAETISLAKRDAVPAAGQLLAATEAFLAYTTSKDTRVRVVSQINGASVLLTCGDGLHPIADLAVARTFSLSQPAPRALRAEVQPTDPRHHGPVSPATPAFRWRCGMRARQRHRCRCSAALWRLRQRPPTPSWCGC